MFLDPTIHVTKTNLYIELHDINEWGCLQIDHVKEILKLTYDGVQKGGELNTSGLTH